MKYRVNFEERVRAEVTVEASSYEEAVAVAKKQKPTKTATGMSPTWVAEETEIKETGEFEYEVLGMCVICETPIVGRDVPGQPWVYSNARPDGLVCYKCAMKKT